MIKKIKRITKYNITANKILNYILINLPMNIYCEERN